MTDLPEPECELGYTRDQLVDILWNLGGCADFDRWMRGQTIALCDGHGPAVYPRDLRNYLEGGPILD